jgi:hypothetical protein
MEERIRAIAKSYVDYPEKMLRRKSMSPCLILELTSAFSVVAAAFIERIPVTAANQCDNLQIR